MTFKPLLQLSEMTADLGEEHSAATLAAERLEAEQSDRMRLEKDKSDLEVRKTIILLTLVVRLEMMKTSYFRQEIDN